MNIESIHIWCSDSKYQRIEASIQTETTEISQFFKFVDILYWYLINGGTSNESLLQEAYHHYHLFKYTALEKLTQLQKYTC